MNAQSKYIQVTRLGVTLLIPAPDPKVKTRHRRNRGRKKLPSLLATINGIGLKNVELLNKVANSAHGVIPPTHKISPKLRKNANKVQRQEWRKTRVRTEISMEPNQLNNFAMMVIDLIRENPFRNPDHVPAGPDLSRNGERNRGKMDKDYYSAFPKQKKSKAAYKAAKKRRIVVTTPRQSPWVVPEKYRALNPQTPPAITAAPVRLNLKPVEGK